MYTWHPVLPVLSLSETKTSLQHFRLFYLLSPLNFLYLWQVTKTLNFCRDDWNQDEWIHCLQASTKLVQTILRDWLKTNEYQDVTPYMQRRKQCAEKYDHNLPPSKVNLTNCAEQSLNVLYRWERTQVPTGLHKAPLLYAFFCHGYATMNETFGHVRPGWEGWLMCLIVWSTGQPLLRDVCSCCGGSAGLNWHPAKSSGRESICWKTSSSHLVSHAYMQTHRCVRADTSV